MRWFHFISIRRQIIWRQKHWINWRAGGGERRVINSHASTVFNGRAQLVYILILSVCVSVRYRFSRQPLNRLLSNLAGVFDMMSERQLSILVSNGCIINDLLHKLCVGRSVTSDRLWYSVCVCLSVTVFLGSHRTVCFETWHGSLIWCQKDS